MATEGHLESGRVGLVVGRVLGSPRGRAPQVVTLRGLVVDDRDGARRARAERVLRGRVGEAPGAQDSDVLGRLVRRARDLVEVPAVIAVKSAHRAVRRDAGCVAGSIDVARAHDGSRVHRSARAARPSAAGAGVAAGRGAVARAAGIVPGARAAARPGAPRADAGIEPPGRPARTRVLPPELGAPPEAEDAPPPELEDELVVSPEPHAQKDAATTETAKGASARVEVFRRTRGQRAVCTIHVAVASECASVNENRRGDEKTHCVAISSDGAEDNLSGNATEGRETLTARRTARSPGPT